jgi:putative oxidoreductase
MHIAKLHHNSDWAFLILRLIVAALFLYHGEQKWGMWTPAVPQQMPVPLLMVFRFLSVVEPIAALAVLVGYWTQIASIGLVLVMISAIVLKIDMFHATFSGQGGWEFELAILASVIVLAFHGAGAFSFDQMLHKKHMQASKKS